MLWGGAGGCEAERPVERIYVASGFTDQVFILDASDGSVLDSLSLDRRPHEVDEPHGLTRAPDGSHWYATLSHGQPSLWKYERDGDRLVGRLDFDLHGAARVGITPDGTHAFIPDYWRGGMGRDGQVAVVRLEDLVVESTLTLCPAPHDAVPDPSGEHVAITCSQSDELLVLDRRTLESVARVAVGPDPGPPGAPVYRPMNATWSADGERIFVTLMTSGEIASLGRSGEALARLHVGGAPVQIALASEGSLLVVPDRAGGLILASATLSSFERVALEGAVHPHGVALSADGETAFVSYEGDVGREGGVVAVDLVSRRVLWTTAIGSYDLGIAVAPAG